MRPSIAFCVFSRAHQGLAAKVCGIYSYLEKRISGGQLLAGTRKPSWFSRCRNSYTSSETFIPRLMSAQVFSGVITPKTPQRLWVKAYTHQSVARQNARTYNVLQNVF